MEQKTTTTRTTTVLLQRQKRQHRGNPTQDFAVDKRALPIVPIYIYVLSSDRIISLTGYFGFIVPRGTRGSGQKKGAGGFAG